MLEGTSTNIQEGLSDVWDVIGTGFFSTETRGIWRVFGSATQSGGCWAVGPEVQMKQSPPVAKWE